MAWENPQKKTCVNPSVPLIHLTTVKTSIFSSIWRVDCEPMLSLQLLGVQNRLCHSILRALPAENLLEAVDKTSSNSISMKLFTGSLLLAKSGDFLSTFSHKNLAFSLHLQIFHGFFPGNFPPSLPSPPLHRCQCLYLYLCQCQLVWKGPTSIELPLIGVVSSQ